MSLEDVNVLKERAIKFLKNAERLFDEKVYDIAAFNVQQFVELYLKYKLFIFAGEYPKTHSIKRLIKELGKFAKKEQEVYNFLEDNIDRISNLENAYITARYLPTEFEKKEVENMIDVAKKIKNFVDELKV